MYSSFICNPSNCDYTGAGAQSAARALRAQGKRGGPAHIDLILSAFGGGQPGLLQIDDDEEMAMLAPFIAGGQSEDGSTYAVFVNQFNGVQLTVSGGIAGEEFDADAYNAVYSVYWQTLFGMIDAMNAE